MQQGRDPNVPWRAPDQFANPVPEQRSVVRPIGVAIAIACVVLLAGVAVFGVLRTATNKAGVHRDLAAPSPSISPSQNAAPAPDFAPPRDVEPPKRISLVNKGPDQITLSGGAVTAHYTKLKRDTTKTQTITAKDFSESVWTMTEESGQIILRDIHFKHSPVASASTTAAHFAASAREVELAVGHPVKPLVMGSGPRPEQIWDSSGNRYSSYRLFDSPGDMHSLWLLCTTSITATSIFPVADQCNQIHNFLMIHD